MLRRPSSFPAVRREHRSVVLLGLLVLSGTTYVACGVTDERSYGKAGLQKDAGAGGDGSGGSSSSTGGASSGAGSGAGGSTSTGGEGGTGNGGTVAGGTDGAGGMGGAGATGAGGAVVGTGGRDSGILDAADDGPTSNAG